MKLLSKILGPRLFKRFALWYYKAVGAPPAFDRGSVFGAMVALRAGECTGPVKNVVSGDSVATAGEPFFELIDDTRCSAIPGDRTDTFLARLALNVLIYQPKTVVMHIGGNDVLAGIDLDLIVSRLAEIHKALRDGGVKRIAWLEILPLCENFADKHKTAGELCAIVKKQLAYDVLEIRKALANERGFIASKYYGDGIHCNALAYNDVFFPVVSKYIRGGK